MDELSLNYDKIALVLPGGGAKGGYHVGAMKMIKEQNPNIKFEVISGVSVGALNAAMLATRPFEELWNVWEDIKQGDVLRKRNWFSLAWHLLSWKAGFNKPLKGIYSNEPLLETIKKHLKGEFKSDLRIGSVNITKRKYEAFQFMKGAKIKDWPDFHRRILSSTAVPGVWPPTQIGEDQYVDGGVRNLAPLGDVLSYDPDLVIIIPCTRYPKGEINDWTDGNIIDTLGRVVDNMTGEVFKNDLKQFLMLNDMVEKAQQKGVILKKDNGDPYKHYETLMVTPSKGLGNPLDFSRNSIDQRILTGISDAKNALNSFREDKLR